MSKSFLSLLKVPEFSVMCLKCEESFTVHFKYIPEKTQLECPCCGQVFNDDALIYLKSAITSLDNALLKLHETNSYSSLMDIERGCGFSLSAKWKRHLPEHGFTGLSDK